MTERWVIGLDIIIVLYLIKFLIILNWQSWLQISLYGHSLGSVLSYDILCHQETLTSPFPMEWIYKDKIKYESRTPNDMKSDDSLGKSFNEIVTIDSTKPDNVTLDQDGLGVESVDHGQSETVSGEEDGSDDCTNNDGLNQTDEVVLQDDENATTKSLREEVN